MTQQLAEERRGALGATPTLDQDVEHISMLVHCASEIAKLAANAGGHLILVLLVARLWPAPLQGAGEQPPEAQATYSDGIVADHHAMEGLMVSTSRRSRREQCYRQTACWITSAGKWKPR